MCPAPAVSCRSLAAIVYAFKADFIEGLRQQSVSICAGKLGISLSQSEEEILSIGGISIDFLQHRTCGHHTC